METTTETTTQDWLDFMNDEFPEGAYTVTNGGDWVAYDFPAAEFNDFETVRVAVNGEDETVEVLGMSYNACHWQSRFSLSTPFRVVAAIVNDANGIQ